MADRLKLFVVPGSHPCAAVERALQLKGLAYDRVDLLPLVHVVHQQLRFGRRTVPAIILPDGSRASGSRPILRVIDALEPDPPLLPADAALRAKVEGAELWGDTTFQSVARRVIWTAFAARPDALPSYAEGANLPIPTSLAARTAGLVIPLERALNRAGTDTARADVDALPGQLDRVDAWIAEGVLGGAQPNVADLQVLSTVRLLQTIEDLDPLIAQRPCAQAAQTLFPVWPGRIPSGALPAHRLT